MNGFAKSDAEFAAQYNCATKTIARARKAGAPLNDPQAMADWFAGRKNSPASAPDIGGKSSLLADVKLQKLQKEVERLQIRIDVEKKKLIPLDDARSQMTRIASAMRSELLRFAGDVPNWQGLSASEMQLRVDAQVRSMCENLHDQFSELYT